MATIQDLANAIIKQEGYGSPNAPTITNANNPGALRSSPFQTGTVNGPNGTFATFASYQDGYNALIYDLTSKANQGLSLRDAIYKYAPPTENDTSSYLNNVSNWLGVGADTLLSVLGGGGNVDGTTSDPNSSASVSDNLFGSPTSGNLAMIVGVGLLAGLVLTKLVG